MTQRIVLFNGPPRSGKDTAALACFDERNWSIFPDKNPIRCFDRMSMPIKRAFASMMGVNIDRFGNVEHWEHVKDEVVPILGVSYRQWQIDFSENFMKLYREAIFGHLFVTRQLLQHKDAVIFVPDCGFDVEYETLAEHFSEENVLVIKIYREGCNFKGDSRDYLKVGSNFPSGLRDDLAEKSPDVVYLTNNGTKPEFETKVLKTVKEWLDATVPTRT